MITKKILEGMKTELPEVFPKEGNRNLDLALARGSARNQSLDEVIKLLGEEKKPDWVGTSKISRSVGNWPIIDELPSKFIGKKVKVEITEIAEGAEG